MTPIADRNVILRCLGALPQSGSISACFRFAVIINFGLFPVDGLIAGMLAVSNISWISVELAIGMDIVAWKTLSGSRSLTSLLLELAAESPWLYVNEKKEAN